jgi:hypothetical protein
MSGIYQYLVGSGDLPKDWRDLYAPRSGGKGLVPEDMLMPGYQKDLHGYIMDPLREGYGKLGGLWQLGIEEATNKVADPQPVRYVHQQSGQPHEACPERARPDQRAHLC